MFNVNIQTRGAAFCDEDGVPYASHEVSRLLRELADQVESEGLYDGHRGTLVDANGNRTGSWTFFES